MNLQNIGSLTNLAEGVRHTVTIGDFVTEFGKVIPAAQIAFQFWGTPNQDLSNIVLVEHALTASSQVTDYLDPTHRYENPWWNRVVGPGLDIDTNKYCVLVTNALGSCYGSTGPGSIHPDGGFFGSRFPDITIRDQVEAEHILVNMLGIHSFSSIIGGSMGGARVLEWLVMYPEYAGCAVILAVGSKASADQIATQSLQLDTIFADPNWFNGDYYDKGVTPNQGLKIARQIAHLTYRCESELEVRFGNKFQDDENPLDYDSKGRFAVTSYLQHHGDKILDRFDAGSYVKLTRSLITHDVGRGRGGVESALAKIKTPTFIGAISTDRLFPVYQQQELADLIPGTKSFVTINSKFGHDGFLLEEDQVGQIIKKACYLHSS